MYENHSAIPDIRSNHVTAKTRHIMSARKPVAATKRRLSEDEDEIEAAPRRKSKVEQSDENEIEEGAVYDAGDVQSVISDGKDTDAESDVSDDSSVVMCRS